MVKLYNSLMIKLCISFMLLILVVTGLTFYYTYGETKRQILHMVRHELTDHAALMALYVDGDIHESIKEGDEDTENYKVLAEKLRAMRDVSQDIAYVYTMRKTDRGVEFVLDADYGTEDAASIGELYEDAPAELLEGFERPSADMQFTTDEWGTVLSGYAPIRDSRGRSVGLVGVDMKSDDVMDMQRFIGSTIYYVMFGGILVATLIIGYISVTIIKDVKRLNYVAQKVSQGDMDLHIDVKRSDEIGELADSFSRMVASLKIMRFIKEKKGK